MAEVRLNGPLFKVTMTEYDELGNKKIWVPPQREGNI